MLSLIRASRQIQRTATLLYETVPNSEVAFLTAAASPWRTEIPLLFWIDQPVY